MNNIEFLEFLNNVAYVHVLMQIISNMFYFSKNKELNNFGVLLTILLFMHFIFTIIFLIWKRPDIFELFSENGIFYLIVFLSFVPLTLMVRKLLIVLFKKYLTKK